MGEAGKEHQAFLLHCIVEMAGNAEPCATDAQYGTLTIACTLLFCLWVLSTCRHGVTERGWTLSPYTKMFDLSGGPVERCDCQEVKGPFWDHSGGPKSVVQNQVAFWLHCQPGPFL